MIYLGTSDCLSCIMNLQKLLKIEISNIFGWLQKILKRRVQENVSLVVRILEILLLDVFRNCTSHISSGNLASTGQSKKLFEVFGYTHLLSDSRLGNSVTVTLNSLFKRTRTCLLLDVTI